MHNRIQPREITTQDLVKDQGKNHKGENPFKIILLLGCHQMFNREIQCSNSSTKRKIQIFDISNN